MNVRNWLIAPPVTRVAGSSKHQRSPAFATMPDNAPPELFEWAPRGHLLEVGAGAPRRVYGPGSRLLERAAPRTRRTTRGASWRNARATRPGVTNGTRSASWSSGRTVSTTPTSSRCCTRVAAPAVRPRCGTTCSTAWERPTGSSTTRARSSARWNAGCSNRARRSRRESRRRSRSSDSIATRRAASPTTAIDASTPRAGSTCRPIRWAYAPRSGRTGSSRASARGAPLGRAGSQSPFSSNTPAKTASTSSAAPFASRNAAPASATV